jgi:hypothetical protein
MRKLKKILTLLFNWAGENDLKLLNRLNHIPGFYQNFTKPGPFMISFLTLFIGILFVPIFALEVLSEKFKWSVDTHDTLYLIYISIIFAGIFAWLVAALILAIKRRSAIRNYAKKRNNQRHRRSGHQR